MSAHVIFTRLDGDMNLSCVFSGLRPTTMVLAARFLSACALSTFASAQVLFQQQPYDAGLFTPFENLSALSETESTSLSHPFFPSYGVRVKKTKFCDGAVK